MLNNNFPTFGESDLGDLASSVVGEKIRPFSIAYQELAIEFSGQLQGKRVLVLGAAGFIARQTLKNILCYKPTYVALVDVNENGLASLVRDLRAGEWVHGETTLDVFLADITAPGLMKRLIGEVDHIDQIYNFAAVKHVRSERDPVSLLRMFQVNVLGVLDSALRLSERFPEANHFVVSTDKAADPANFMGASKRISEAALARSGVRFSCTRFANVAFSSGSLLDSWLDRLREREPLVVPSDIRRFLVTPRASGELCMVAGLAPVGTCVIPEFRDKDALNLEEVLLRTLRYFKARPVRTQDWQEALRVVREGRFVGGEVVYPYLVTERRTSGEKELETMLGRSERASPWLPGLLALDLYASPDDVSALIDWLRHLSETDSRQLEVTELLNGIRSVLPNFSYKSGDTRLDDHV